MNEYVLNFFYGNLALLGFVSNGMLSYLHHFFNFATFTTFWLCNTILCVIISYFVYPMFYIKKNSKNI